MELQEKIIKLRRELHSFPEATFEEYKTADKMAELLEKLGATVTRYKTGVVGVLGQGDKTVAIRADMDALSVDEQLNVPFRSQNPGFMHACGHDGHMAMIWGAAAILAKKDLPGRVKIIFQPAEEKVKGADFLISEGVLDDVDEIYGCHIVPEFPSGEVHLKIGPAMATSDLYELTVIGRSGHGARPESGQNAILMANQVINAILCYTAQFCPLDSAVVNFGMIEGGVRYNIIPERVKITGTVRTLDEKLRDEIEAKLGEIVRSIANLSGGDYEYNYERGCGVLDNHEAACHSIEKVCQENKVPFFWEDKPMLIAEDFGNYLKKTKGAYFWYGTRNEDKECIYSLHHAKYNIDEDILLKGAELFAALVENRLRDLS